MSEEKWLTVYEYAKLVGKSPSQVYLDIRLGKIPTENVARKKVVVERLRVKEPNDNN